MKLSILGLAAAAAFAASTAAHAQITTLEYTGYIGTGTSTSLPTGSLYGSTLPSTAFSGSFTALISVQGSVGANDLNLVSFSVNFNSTTIKNFSTSVNQTPYPLNYFGGTDFTDGNGDYIDFTTSSSGAINGAAINIDIPPAGYPGVDLSIGPGGDAFSYVFSNSNGGCENQYSGGPGSKYTGPTINPCTATAVNDKAGVWSAAQTAPEIEPASALGACSLLVGGLLVLHGRRPRITAR